MTFEEAKAILVELEEADEAEFTRAHALSLKSCSTTRMADDYDEALANCIAHRIVMERRRRGIGLGAMGPGDRINVNAENAAGRAGESRSSDAVMLQMENWWMRSQFGQRYHQILNIAGSGGLAV